MVKSLYHLPIWRGPNGLRAKALRRDGFTCRSCGAALTQGRTRQTDAVVDHIIPHRGSWALFADIENLQSLCKRCHDSAKRRIEIRGYSDEVGQDGFPIDPGHPFNARR